MINAKKCPMKDWVTVCVSCRSIVKRIQLLWPLLFIFLARSDGEVNVKGQGTLNYSYWNWLASDWVQSWTYCIYIKLKFVLELDINPEVMLFCVCLPWTTMKKQIKQIKSLWNCTLLTLLKDNGINCSPFYGSQWILPFLHSVALYLLPFFAVPVVTLCRQFIFSWYVHWTVKYN